MKAMKFPCGARRAMVIFCSVLVLCCSRVGGALVERRIRSERTLHKAVEGAADVQGKLTDDRDDESASKDDDQQGDDDDDDDDDDSEDAKSVSAVATASVKVDPHAKERAELQKAVDEAGEELSVNLAQQKKLQHDIDNLGDLSSSDHEIDSSAKLVANETQSPSMADMLGKMWKEIRMFEIPAYTKHAEEEIQHLRRKEKRIEQELTAAEAAVSTAKRKWAGGAAEDEKVSLAKSSDDKAKEGPAPTVYPLEEGVRDVHEQTVESAVLHSWSVWHMSANQQKSVFFSSLVYLLLGTVLAFAYKQARSKPNEPFQPSPRPGMQNQSQQKDFSFSLFGCFGDMNVCLVGCCCPCLRWADTVDRKQLLPYWWGFSLMFGLMLLHVYTMGLSTLIAAIVGFVYRQRLRKKYGFDSGTLLTLAYDLMAWFCCQPCAVVQEAREEAAHTVCSPIGSPASPSGP